MRVVAHHPGEALEREVRRARDARVRDRLRMVWFASQGESAPEVAGRLGVSVRSVFQWVGRYNHSGLEGLVDRPRSGQPKKLAASAEPGFLARLDAPVRAEDQVAVLRGVDIQRILAEEFDACYSLSGVYDLLHRLGRRSLVPRPRHPKSDPQAQAEWKKNPTPEGARDRIGAPGQANPTLGRG